MPVHRQAEVWSGLVIAHRGIILRPGGWVDVVIAEGLASCRLYFFSSSESDTAFVSRHQRRRWMFGGSLHITH